VSRAEHPDTLCGGREGVFVVKQTVHSNRCLCSVENQKLRGSGDCSLNTSSIFILDAGEGVGLN
jgi:hypothetical protein